MCDSLNEQCGINLFHVLPYKSSRVIVKNLPNKSRLRLLGNLKYVLGFIDNTITQNNYIAEFDAQLNLAFAMYIYSNILSYTIVGDSHVPLLATIPITKTKKYGEIVSHEILNPMFVKVKQQDISQIHIQIRTKTGCMYELSPQSDVLLTLKFIKT